MAAVGTQIMAVAAVEAVVPVTIHHLQPEVTVELDSFHRLKELAQVMQAEVEAEPVLQQLQVLEDLAEVVEVVLVVVLVHFSHRRPVAMA
jgi:hypothetical protein